jgi:hypothetical protein
MMAGFYSEYLQDLANLAEVLTPIGGFAFFLWRSWRRPPPPPTSSGPAE